MLKNFPKMKKLLKISALTIISFLMFNCTKDEVTPTNSDPIIGKWRTISETENGVAEVLSACELMDRYEFKPDGVYVNQSYESEGGACVLEPNGGLPTGSTAKWVKTASNAYKYVISDPNLPTPVEIPFTVVFSNNNNTLTATYIEEAGTPDQVIQVSVNERVN